MPDRLMMIRNQMRETSPRTQVQWQGKDNGSVSAYCTTVKRTDKRITEKANGPLNLPGKFPLGVGSQEQAEPSPAGSLTAATVIFSLLSGSSCLATGNNG